MSKSTLLINKTIVTHGGTTPITKELNKKNRDHAFCIFITGLKASFTHSIFLFSARFGRYTNKRARFAQNFGNVKKVI